MNVLVTGANGFVGTHLCRMLEASGNKVVRAVRNSQPGTVAVGDIDGSTDWTEALRGVTAVVHLAARAHVMYDPAPDSLMEFRKVNVQGTQNLARQAAKAGVKRFVFISSIKVNGEATCGEKMFTERDAPSPQDPYGISKREAEEILHSVARETGLEVTVLRPPLVYGPGVEANFLRLMKLAASGIPLPLRSVKNFRSLVSVGNLCDLISRCLIHPAAPGETFLVSDGQDVSIPELLRMLATAQHKKARLFSIPPSVLGLAGRLTGRSAEMERLCDSLQVDISHTRKVLGWMPPFTLEEGVLETAAYLLASDNPIQSCKRK